MTALDDFRRLGAHERGLAVAATTRADGSVQASVVNAGVLAHPLTDAEVVGFVVRGDALKQRLLRSRPRTVVVIRSGWEWVAAEGAAELIGPDDPHRGVGTEGLRLLLRSVFRSAGGTHDDWARYDRVMTEERRCAVLIQPDRVYGVTTQFR